MPVLIGGRRPVKAKIKRVRKLGSGKEGTAYEVEAELRSGGKRRKITLVEKVFHPFKKYKTFGNPKEQFRIMNEISELNRRENLGLHIPNTIRLRRRWFRKPALISSKFERIRVLEGKQITDYFEDALRELEILRKKGYSAGPDAFMPVLDKESGKAIAVIFDFGLISKIQ